MEQRTWVATLEDGSQVLIDFWPGREAVAGRAAEPDTLTVATRERRSDVWGPPVTAQATA